ncbi:hypothetical protein YC2023_088932 [Brassica napus]
MKRWNAQVDDTCVICNASPKSRDHLFFSCTYATEVWSSLSCKLMGTRFTTTWSNILNCLVDKTWSISTMFLLRYVFQATVYSIWRERNWRRHGESNQDQARLSKFIDQLIQNRIGSLRGVGYRKYYKLLRVWSAHR